MLCCLCKEREADVHLSQFIGDDSQFVQDEPTDPANLTLVAQVDLCNNRAKHHHVNDPKGFSFSFDDLLAAVKKARRE